MSGLIWPPQMGSFVWGGQSLIWPGAQPLNIERLWVSAPIETNNLQQPGIGGRLPRDVLLEQLEVQIDYHLSGLVLPDGSPAPNVAWGIEANRSELVARVGTPSTWPTPRGVTASVLKADGVTISGLVQGAVSGLGERQGSVGTCVLSVTIPDGMLYSQGS